MSGDNEFGISEITVTACKLFSQIISALCMPFLLLAIILFFHRRRTNHMVLFSLQFSFACFLNAVNYLLPYEEPENKESVSVMCRIQSLIHILSLLLTLNMLFIYYLLNFMIFDYTKLALSRSTHRIIYIINWLLMIGFTILNLMDPPNKTRLKYCRYDKEATCRKINTIYSIVLIVVITILFILIQCKVTQKIRVEDNENLLGNLKNIRWFFLFIISMILVKVFSYFFKEGHRQNFMFVMDRICENVTNFLLIIFVIIGKKGFVEFYNILKRKNSSLNSSTVENRSNNFAQMQKMDALTSDSEFLDDDD